MDVDLRMCQLDSGICVLRIARLGLALLLENSNFTPLPVVMCVMVLYSPSSSSLSA